MIFRATHPNPDWDLPKVQAVPSCRLDALCRTLALYMYKYFQEFMSGKQFMCICGMVYKDRCKSRTETNSASLLQPFSEKLVELASALCSILLLR